MPTAVPHSATSRVVALVPVERDTIPRIFFGGVDRHDRGEALRHKEGGVWKSLSHREVEERVRRLAAALEAAGVETGDRVAILSENRPEWALTDYAVTGLGAVDVPVYATLPASQIAYILEDSGAKAVFVSTREQLAKIIEIRGELPDLALVASFDDPGGAEGVLSFADLLAEGEQRIAAGQAGDFRARALAVGRDDVATLIYTSGTTGNPKGVMLTHWNLASNVAGCLQHGLDQVIRKGDVTLSFLPLSHVFERMVDYLYWEVGACIAYGDIYQVIDEMGEVRPSVAVSVPRLFDKIYTVVMGATGAKKAIVMWAKRVGEAVADARLAGGEPPALVALQYRLADRLVFSKLRERTGGRIRCFVSGGAPLSAEVAKFLYAAGIPVYEGYGLTETAPVIAVNRPGAIRLGSVGQPIPGVEVRIDAETGEILARGPNIMRGYYNNPEATAEVIGEDGWFHTGDIGELTPDGFLRITDRLKNLIITAGGKNVAPQPMENLAAMSPYVAQAVMIGDRRPFTALLVVPDFDNLDSWARQQGIQADDREALARDPRVVELLERETLDRLTGFARYERPKKISVIAEEFTVDNGLLTPTLKVKRRAVEDRYRGQIESVYEGVGPES